MWLYYTTLILTFGLGFPGVNIAMNTLFSRIIGPRRQATLQGVQQMFGGVARLTGPLLISNLYHQFGPRLAWLMEMAVLVATVALWAVFYKRMVPLRLEEAEEEVKEDPLDRSVSSVDLAKAAGRESG